MMNSTCLQNANLQPPQAQFPLPKAEVPSPPVGRALPLFNTSHPLVGPATQPLAGHIQNASNILPEPRILVTPIVPVVSTSAPEREKPVSLLANPHPNSHLVLLSPLVRLLPLSARQSCPVTPRSTATSRVGASGSRKWSWNPRPSDSTRFLHAKVGSLQPDAITPPGDKRLM